MSETVSVCIIVGNGFDLAAGLGTSTETFFQLPTGKTLMV